MRILYLVRQSMQSLRRNALVVMGAVLAVFVSLVLVFGAIVLTELVRQNTTRWEDGVRLVAFVRDELPDTAINAMISEVQAWDEVDEVFFFTKAEAYQEAQILFRDDQAFLELLNEQPTLLPASIRVKPVNTDVYSTLETRLKATPGVFDVQSASKAIDAIVAIKAGLTQLVLGLAILLGASAIALIANTIRMAIYARRDEIGIMRLVGAGNWFIRIPFLLEGMIEGLVGGLLAIGAIVVGYQFLLDRTQSAPEWITVDIPTDFFFQWGFFTVVFGVVVGVLASGIALWRFMRE